jgi:ubiquinone/menaquinone biosynthesis C-methylase UbiE
MLETRHEQRLRRGVRLWNLAARPNRGNRTVQSWQEPLWTLATETLALRQGDTVVDVGCGPGSALPALRDAVGATGRVVGTDLSPSMLAVAQRVIDEHDWDNVELRQADLCRDRLEAGTYDAVLASFVLAAVPDIDAAIDNLSDALRPGGRLFVGDMYFGPHPAARALRRVYRAVTAGAAGDVVTALHAEFATVEPVVTDRGRAGLPPPGRSWPPVAFVVTTKAG